MTKDSELLEEIDAALKALEGGETALRHAAKAMRQAADTLRFNRNVIMQRSGVVPEAKHRADYREHWRLDDETK